jgi:hypothetical protein
MGRRLKKLFTRLHEKEVVTETHGEALNALFCVSCLIAENVLVITATKRLMSQKFSTTIQIIKKTEDMKNSASIIEYIRGDH